MRAAQLVDRFGHERLIHVEAHLRDRSGLLLPEDVASASNLEITRRDLEPSAELRESLQHLDAPTSFLRQISRRNEKTRESARLRSTDASSELIELRETQTIGAIDDDRVGVRNVETRLDDGRRHEDVELAVHEVDHDALEPLLLHLTVPHDDARLGHELLDKPRKRADRRDAVVHHEALPAAADLAKNCVANDVLGESVHLGLHREPIGWWRRHDRHVANAHESHV